MRSAHLADMLEWQRTEQAFLERCAGMVRRELTTEEMFNADPVTGTGGATWELAKIPVQKPPAPRVPEAEEWFEERREEALQHQLATEAEWAAADEQAMWADGPRAYCRRAGE
jgi:hypothetical protein